MHGGNNKNIERPLLSRRAPSAATQLTTSSSHRLSITRRKVGKMLEGGSDGSKVFIKSCKLQHYGISWNLEPCRTQNWTLFWVIENIIRLNGKTLFFLVTFVRVTVNRTVSLSDVQMRPVVGRGTLTENPITLWNCVAPPLLSWRQCFFFRKRNIIKQILVRAITWFVPLHVFLNFFTFSQLYNS